MLRARRSARGRSACSVQASRIPPTRSERDHESQNHPPGVAAEPARAVVVAGSGDGSDHGHHQVGSRPGARRCESRRAGHPAQHGERRQRPVHDPQRAGRRARAGGLVARLRFP